MKERRRKRAIRRLVCVVCETLRDRVVCVLYERLCVLLLLLSVLCLWDCCNLGASHVWLPSFIRSTLSLGSS